MYGVFFDGGGECFVEGCIVCCGEFECGQEFCLIDYIFQDDCG